MPLRPLTLLLAALLCGLPALAAEPSPATAAAPAAAARPDAEAQFRALYRREWAWRLAQNPTFASSVGERRHDHLLEQAGDAAMQARLQPLRQFRAELAEIDLAALPPARRIDARILASQLDNAIAGIEVGEHLLPLTSDSSFYADLAHLPRLHRFDDPASIDAYLDRLVQVPRYFDQHIELLTLAIERGMTLPKVVLAGREQPLRELAELDDVTRSSFYRPLAELPGLNASDRTRLQQRARRVLREQVQPAYRKLLGFMVDTYIPAARETLAAEALPNGKAYYRQQIRNYTTLDLEPAAIHATGLAEVARITAEMDKVRAEVGFDGDLPAFFAHLRQAPEFKPKSAEELLMRASWIAKRIDGLLPKYFGTLPRLPYTVAPVPEAIAPYYTAGRYVSPPSGSLEPGTYWVNTHALESRLLYTLPALTLHEAVPGHHLQGALAEEQSGQPPFRRHSYISAYGEGWALYTEWLGLEMGVYQTPYEQFGRLTYEMWRACRLVVDTGVHSMGWTRQQALDYMLGHTALSEHEITTEVDRYISWPGQALSYKLGELKIRELRLKAEAELGERFDLRAFHDAVLAQGSVPLPVLEEQIGAFIEAARAEAD